MKFARILNIPDNPKEILDYAKSKSYDFWIDEKGTKDHPEIWQRKASELTYEEAFDIIQHATPHWVFQFRNESDISPNLKDFWEFGGCNISRNDYGDVFIWIKVDIPSALEIFEKFNLKFNLIVT